MKKVYSNEKWCLGCKLCEYNCAFANTNKPDMATALKNSEIVPRIRVEEKGKITFAVSCRHCADPICVKACITGALYKDNEIIMMDKNKCVNCLTCVLVCPYGALAEDSGGAVFKCELCVKNTCGEPACVKGCPNRALLYEERKV